MNAQTDFTLTNNKANNKPIGNAHILSSETVLSPDAMAEKYGMTAAALEEFGTKMDAIRDKHLADRGDRDTSYIRKLIRVQRGLEVAGRGLLYASIPALLVPPLAIPVWAAGVASLGLAKILDNMEIGHNIMHGQYDWTGDPALNSKTFEWDAASPSANWRNSHNYEHHTYTNIVGKDRDVGYGTMRMSDAQPWHPVYLGNPLYATLLALNFDAGVSLHDLEIERIRSGELTWKEQLPVLKRIGQKAVKQYGKDYLFFPALAGPFFLPILLGNLVANGMRNLWAFTIIFCGHFPDGVEQFTNEAADNETRGQWYFRQLLGSANLEGGKLFHIMSGNLSHQIEHHLFPDVPAHRYAEMAVEVQAECKKHGLPYNTGPLHKQFATVVGRICRLALPNRKGDKPNNESAGNTLAAA